MAARASTQPPAAAYLLTMFTANGVHTGDTDGRGRGVSRAYESLSRAVEDVRGRRMADLAFSDLDRMAQEEDEE